METALVNYWYAPPVGHTIEALRYCLGYKAADPTLRVALLLSAATPTELAGCCSFVDAVYPVGYTSFAQPEGDPAAALAAVPRVWDWVVDNHREREAEHDRFTGFRAFFDASHAHFAPRRGHTWTGEQPPTYRPHQQLRLELPRAARAAAEALVCDRSAISVVLAGSSSPSHLYPSAASWRLVLSELSRLRPDAAICLIGRFARDERTRSRIAPGTLDVLRNSVAACVDCFDRPLLEQLAIVERSLLCVSPHTGFGFAAVAVGTPWLALSGGNWHEYFFNGVPFYSVLPDVDRYPCFGWGAPLPTIEADEDGEGPRTASMCVARIREDLPELLHYAQLLIDGELSYEDALTDYFPRLLAAYHGDRDRVFTFDGVHRSYL